MSEADDMSAHARSIAVNLIHRNETLAVAESSAGGLISATLLAVPGASAFFLGGAVVYTYQAREVFLEVRAADLKGVTPSTEAYALLLARAARTRLSAIWGLAETGTAGPTGSRYGYNAGRTCVAVVGPMEQSLVVETGHGDRAANMQAFAATALGLMARVLAGIN